MSRRRRNHPRLHRSQRRLPAANRLQIKQAVETLLKVKVERVNVLNVQGKIKRLGRFSGKRSDWKKAFVKLKAGEKLELYESA